MRYVSAFGHMFFFALSCFITYILKVFSAAETALGVLCLNDLFIGIRCAYFFAKFSCFINFDNGYIEKKQVPQRQERSG